jgi:hypothetical protein
VGTNAREPTLSDQVRGHESDRTIVLLDWPLGALLDLSTGRQDVVASPTPTFETRM